MKNSLIMSKETHTDMGFWLNMTIPQFSVWIREYNEIIKESENSK